MGPYRIQLGRTTQIQLTAVESAPKGAAVNFDRTLHIQSTERTSDGTAGNRYRGIVVIIGDSIFISLNGTIGHGKGYAVLQRYCTAQAGLNRSAPNVHISAIGPNAVPVAVDGTVPEYQSTTVFNANFG